MQIKIKSFFHLTLKNSVVVLLTQKLHVCSLFNIFHLSFLMNELVINQGYIWNVPTGKRYCMNGVALQFKPDQ